MSDKFGVDGGQVARGAVEVLQSDHIYSRCEGCRSDRSPPTRNGSISCLNPRVGKCGDHLD